MNSEQRTEAAANPVVSLRSMFNVPAVSLVL
jgi:hypothetical protein